MVKRKLGVEELMQLYEEIPDLIIYKNDLLTAEKMRYVEEVAGKNEAKNLNPLDVVLESLINVLSEKLSVDTVTQSKDIVYVDKSMQELAAQEIVSLVKSDLSFLKTIHRKWLEELCSFVSGLKEKGTETIQEAIFQVSLQFRISASSGLKAIASLTQ